MAVKVMLVEKIMEDSLVKVGKPSFRISPTIPHTSGRSSSYSLPLTRKREWTMPTPPVAKTTHNVNLSRPVHCREMREVRKERTILPMSASAPTSMSKPVLYFLLLLA